MEDDDLMIVGAKKKNEIKNSDKYDIRKCETAFGKFVFLESENFTRENLVDLCIKGELEKNLIRPTIWKLLLATLPIESDISEWPEILKNQREFFKKKMKTLNSLKKFSGNPLDATSDSSWNTFFEDNELKKIINLDVSRTYQDKELFQTQIVKEIMFNILFIWSKENKNISYKQGMNELLAVIIFSLYPFYFYSSDKSKKTFENIATMMRAYEEKHLKDIYLFFHDMEEFQSDLFFLFDAIMNKGIKDLFDTAIVKKSELSSYKKQDLFQPQWTDDNETDADQMPLQKRCQSIIKKKLKLVDEELFNHFLKIDLNCSIFLQRWLKCIFNREFHPRDVVILWDAILAHEFALSSGEEKDKLILIDYISVGMINYIREDLLRKDQNDCFQRLFKYPPLETPLILVKCALQIKDLLLKKTKKSEVKSQQSFIKSEDKKEVRYSVSNYLKTSKEKDSNITNTTNSVNPVVVKKENNYTPTNKTIDIIADNVFFSSSEEIEPNSQIINKLENIFKKYKQGMELSDAMDFESIIEVLKSNLSE